MLCVPIIRWCGCCHRAGDGWDDGAGGAGAGDCAGAAQAVVIPQYPVSASDKVVRTLEASASNRAAIIHLFKYLDASGDGKLSMEDIKTGDAAGGESATRLPWSSAP